MRDRIAGAWRTLETFAHLRRVHDVPLSHSVPDFLTFRRLLGARRGDFLTLWLWDRSLPMAERLRFLCDDDRLALEHLFSPKAERRAVRDKARVSEILEQAGIATPPTLAVIRPSGDPVTHHRVLARPEDLEDALGTPLPHGLVCKPNFGIAGHDVQVFVSADRNGLVHRDGTSWSLERLWNLCGQHGQDATYAGEPIAWKLEHRIPPAPMLDRIHGPTLGCLRIVTFRRADGRLQTTPLTWKIPSGSTGIDNVSTGSFTAAVDPSTGLVGTPLDQATMTWHTHHPDSGHSLTGLRLPMAAAAVALALRAAECFPALGSLGFDVGLGSDGPTIVEVNPYWGAWFMQAPHRRGLIQGAFLEFLEEIGAKPHLRLANRGLQPMG